MTWRLNWRSVTFMLFLALEYCGVDRGAEALQQGLLNVEIDKSGVVGFQEGRGGVRL